MELESSSLCLKGTTMYPSAAPHQSSPGPLSNFLKINFNIIIPCTPTTSKQSPLLRFPHLNPVFSYPLPLYAACLFHLILLDFFTKYLGSTYHEHPHYAFPSSSLLPWTSQDMVSSSAPYLQKPSAYATVSVTKFHSHIKKTILYILMYAFWINTKDSGLNGSRHSQSLICS